MTAITIHVKDVDNELPTKPRHRRPAGEIISPLDYTNDVVNFDHWDHMFLTNCCKSLTLYNFDGPPATILDLGCGRGLWAIEAAKQWQGSMVVGFDAVSRQPRLSILDKNLSRRLKWVHGNLLDGLPFLDGQFDFVRMVRMGLHIPEDEWGYVFGEISRVLHPNGVLEIIEEDLIFPSQTPQSSDVSPGGSSNGSWDLAHRVSQYSNSVGSLPSLVRTAKPEYLTKYFHRVQSTANPLRDYFERDWMNWENDMADRTCVRGSIQSELSWDEPPGEPPEWRGRSNSMSPLIEETDCEERTDLCRSLRGFVCFQVSRAHDHDV
ncbi:hypothetical protein PAXINDRAFT_100698 [Paxillus involutus ATCC 200175]|uniref:Methyltransferase domain-containing protein n=1 Tax=Paxillus involutus ATCC 200175 TaxID=664439 RepID=A0A0C9U143_PAXIN|nr:hypothetical protein PAXINDRAFT_100698 [Paxillus involutus ATCC 200175]